jgi:hypothetical protein
MEQRISQRVLILLLLALLCSGCAFGHKINYHEALPSFQGGGQGAIRVTTYDQRPYVVSGNKVPQFVGLTRGGFGNPFGVQTQSGHPLAEDMSQVLCNALQKKGFQCLPVAVAARTSPDAVRRKLLEAPSKLALLLTLDEWKSDTFIATTLLYDATLQVLTPQGTTVTEQRITGREVLGKNFWSPISVAYTAVPQAQKTKLEELMNRPEVIAALQASTRR